MAERAQARAEFDSALQRLRGLSNETRSRVQSSFAQTLMEETFTVATAKGPIAFVLLGRGSDMRARSLGTKQPETLAWIDRFEPSSVFWDVGANVGVFTLYAALRGDVRVVAIEPAAVNYFLLAANCEVNGFDDRVDCLLVGLGREKGLGRLAVSQFAAGRSFGFRREQSEDTALAHQAALLLSMDTLVEEFGVPAPHYIKVDVPVLTEEIVSGGMRTLTRPGVRELHVEMREHSEGGQRIVRTLADLGFEIAARHPHGGSADVTFARPRS